MGQLVGDSVLASAMWEWSTYLSATVKEALAGTWKTHEYWGGLKDGVVKLSALSPKVPANVKKEVEAAQKKIRGGWSIFAGPIKGQYGKVVYPAGQVVPDAKQASMDWFVEGVVGKIQYSYHVKGAARQRAALFSFSLCHQSEPRWNTIQGGPLSRCGRSPSPFPASRPTTASTFPSIQARSSRSWERMGPEKAR